MTIGERVRARLDKAFPKSSATSAESPPRAEKLVADGRTWIKVEGSKPWRPTSVGDVLIGELLGRSTRPGDNGTVYGVVTVRTKAGTHTVSGVVITGLFEAAGCPDGSTVRIVYRGEHVSPNKRTWRDFELYLAADEAQERA